MKVACLALVALSPGVPAEDWPSHACGQLKGRLGVYKKDYARFHSLVDNGQLGARNERGMLVNEKYDRQYLRDLHAECEELDGVDESMAGNYRDVMWSLTSLKWKFWLSWLSSNVETYIVYAVCVGGVLGVLWLWQKCYPRERELSLRHGEAEGTCAHTRDRAFSGIFGTAGRRLAERPIH